MSFKKSCPYEKKEKKESKKKATQIRLKMFSLP